MRYVNPRPVSFVPRIVRSKASTDAGRRFVIWFAHMNGNVYQIGQTGELMAAGRDRRRDWISGDFIPLRRFRYWPSNLETAHQNA